MEELSPCVCMSASIWINIHSELMIIITRVLLDNFGLKNTFLMKKYQVKSIFFMMHLAVVLDSFCILTSAVVLDSQAL